MADLKKRYKEFKKVVVVEDEGFLLLMRTHSATRMSCA